MGSYGGHVLPGTFFILFGLWYTAKFITNYLKRKTQNKNGTFRCCGKIPFSGMVIEGMVKISFISIGILIELFYPGAPMGKLHSSTGSFTGPANWQHATMYFFFGLAGVCDILSHTARHIIPAGIDRLGAAIALFVEGYLFYFHLHGRSEIDTRVHILLVITVWGGALFSFAQIFLMNKRKYLHVTEMMSVVLLMAQGTWFWQVAYILYPPGQPSWDPCTHGHSSHGGECNDGEAMLNNMFITLFWTWHVAASMIFVGITYYLIYLFLKMRRQLDSRFLQPYEHLNGKINSSTPLNGALLSEEEEEL